MPASEVSHQAFRTASSARSFLIRFHSLAQILQLLFPHLSQASVGNIPSYPINACHCPDYGTGFKVWAGHHESSFDVCQRQSFLSYNTLHPALHSPRGFNARPWQACNVRVAHLMIHALILLNYSIRIVYYLSLEMTVKWKKAM